MIKTEKLRKLTALALSAALCVSVLSPAVFAETGAEASTEISVESSVQPAAPKAKKGTRSQSPDSADTQAAAEQTPSAEESTAPPTAKGGKAMRGPGADAEEPENALGREAAVSKALAEAGLSSDEAGDVTVRVAKNTDGATVYRVHFTGGDQSYSYEIGAVSGEILFSDVSNLSGGAGQQRSGQRGNQPGSSQPGVQQGSGQSGSRQGSGHQGPGRRGGQRGNQPGRGQQSFDQPCPYCGRGGQGLRDGSCMTASPVSPNGSTL